MKIAIHHREGSFSDRWISYCRENSIEYKIVDGFSNNIIEDLKDCELFMWHHHPCNFKDVLCAKKILYSLENTKILAYPNFSTGWHFDDKVAQKYLFEAIDAPLVPSYVFYDKATVLEWIDKTTFPKVFKLKGGAGSANVKLVNSKKEARRLANIAFGKGFSQFNRIENLKERLRKFKEGKDSWIGVLKGVARLFITTEFDKQQPKEKGYIYFQDFIENNNFDVRVVVLDGKIAAAEKRFVRENDFRASGSGSFTYDGIDLDIIATAFEVSKKLNFQSIAFDFVKDKNGHPLIIEVSYGFGVDGIEKVPGYWDDNLDWHNKEFKPEEIIIKDLIAKLK